MSVDSSTAVRINPPAGCADQPLPEVVRREEIPAIHSVMEGGREHILGILQEFRKHDRLDAFLPKDHRVAIAWVHLDAGQTLEAHVHPVDSMILVCKGSVRALGDREVDLSEGDVLLVPHGSLHGFTGTGGTGFWGISMQFNSRGLYEDLDDPWATFLDEAAPMANSDDPLAVLLARNDRHLMNFSKHRLFTLARQGVLSADKARGRFLDCFQVWSNYFQRMVQARAAFSEDRSFAALAQDHLQEELGHNVLLERGRSNAHPIWDPALESTCSWFVWKMMTMGDAERAVLVHLVVEASADVFYREMSSVMSRPETLSHFDAHASATDDRHLHMGMSLLRQLHFVGLNRLISVQEQGWKMLGHMFGRIADLVTLSDPELHSAPALPRRKP